MRQALDVLEVLRSLGLAQGDVHADITVGSRDNAVLLSLKRVHVSSVGAGADREVLRHLRSVDLEHTGMVRIELTTPGTCLRGSEARLVQKLFEISVEAWSSGAGTVMLSTFSDAWMSHNLRGHKQPEAQEANAPRLGGALAAITRLTEAEVVPSDPTSYGVPTEVGFAELPDEDPDLLDSWHMFEVPRRTELLQAKLPPRACLYETQTDLPVDFVEVANNGLTVGYLWGADGDDAAGYEPYTPTGEASLDAGEEWLARLSQAKERGLPPSEALRELSSWSGNARSGAVLPGSLRTASSLEDLQDLSGRE
ncbi:hypothetical protein [Streptomyces sp. TP-A0356]|uniref:hypothetical protein n=1 Tax=Streptomyces sp. TP-A0356 TaxID=1359208 RepID=UPI00131BC410|nr:hypothetical protein [Streptomyces sp. TP-A0356]